jgi:hypothetical protein
MGKTKVSESTKVQRVESALRIKRAHNKKKVYLTAEGLKHIERMIQA